MAGGRATAGPLTDRDGVAGACEIARELLSVRRGLGFGDGLVGTLLRNGDGW
jgi:hypothetical protein